MHVIAVGDSPLPRRKRPDCRAAVRQRHMGSSRSIKFVSVLVGICRDGISDCSGHFFLRHPFRHLTGPCCFVCMSSLVIYDQSEGGVSSWNGL